MFFGLGFMEILVVLGLALILFAPKLPRLARYLGTSVTQVRKGVDEAKDELQDSIKSE